MINITTNLWIGTSKDAEQADFQSLGINTVLNVAHDLQINRGWKDGILYAQCGLVDGPGNHLAVYHAALLMLATFITDERGLMVCCHSGGRSLAIILMYLNLTNARGWEGWLEMLRERQNLAEPHVAHKKAFEKIDWDFLTSIMGE